MAHTKCLLHGRGIIHARHTTIHYVTPVETAIRAHAHDGTRLIEWVVWIAGSVLLITSGSCSSWHIHGVARLHHLEQVLIARRIRIKQDHVALLAVSDLAANKCPSWEVAG